MSGERSGSRISHGEQSLEHATILLPDGWPRPQGYSNGMAASGRIVAVAGQIGWNPVKQRIENDDLTLQVRQALVNIEAVLRSAGAIPSDLVRMTWFITDRDAYLKARKEIGRAYREIFGKHYPAMSVVVVAGLLDPRAKVEIEATAVISAARNVG
jgi:enamine deaminase RidA (YjgF/YER057c/UK114 family)